MEWRGGIRTTNPDKKEEVKMKTIVKGIMMALIIFCSASVALAYYTVNWPTTVNGDEQGATHQGVIVPNVAPGVHMIVDIDLETGDLYIYKIHGSDGSPGNVQFPDGRVSPAFMYGKMVGRDSVTGAHIYDVYVSGSGVAGTFAFCCTVSL